MAEPKITLPKAPYDRNGSLESYVEPHRVDMFEWRDNEPFHATLQVQEVESGRSAKHFILRSPNSDDKREYPMFATDLLYMLEKTTVINAIVSGRWFVRKRGRNYGLAYLGES